MEDHLSQQSKSKFLNPKSGQGLRMVSDSPFNLKLHRSIPLRGHALPKPVVTPVHSVNTNETTTKNRALLKGTPPPLKHVQGVSFTTNAQCCSQSSCRGQIAKVLAGQDSYLLGTPSHRRQYTTSWQSRP